MPSYLAKLLNPENIYMTDGSISLIDPDTPIRTRKDDLFSFAPLAESVAKHILTYSQSESVVIGVSGSWGSGKTSLLNLIDEAISNQCTNEPKNLSPKIIRYSPWLIGNRSTLLADFLLLLCTKLINETSGSLVGLRHLIRLKRQFWDYRKFRKYAIAISSKERDSGLLSRVASKVAIPLLSEVWELLTKFLNTLRLKPDVVNFDDLRTSACEALERRKQRIIVLLDDLDRLDPDEIMEILRLIRSTAQLPNITYILCFDKQRIADTIKDNQGTDGNYYTDKIAQLVINVPKPSFAILSDLLRERLTALLSDSDSNASDEASFFDQLYNVMAIIAPLNILKTPRDITRIYNSFAFEFRMNRNINNELGKSILNCVLQVKLPNIYNCLRQYANFPVSNQDKTHYNLLFKRIYSELQVACDQDNVDFANIEGIVKIIVPEFDWSEDQ